MLANGQSCGAIHLRLLAAHPESHHLLIENILEGKEEGRRQHTLGNLGANAYFTRQSILSLLTPAVGTLAYLCTSQSILHPSQHVSESETCLLSYPSGQRRASGS